VQRKALQKQSVAYLGDNMSGKELEKQVEINTSSISLIQKDLSYMTKGIDELKQMFNEFAKNLADGFVTKAEFNNLQEKVDGMVNLKDWAIKIILGAIIIALLALVGIGIGHK
jgi:hypothetical protein